jgi:hypothetical protein
VGIAAKDTRAGLPNDPLDQLDRDGQVFGQRLASRPRSSFGLADNGPCDP